MLFPQGINCQEWAESFAAEVQRDPSLTTNTFMLSLWFVQAIMAGFNYRNVEISNRLDEKFQSWKKEIL